MKQSEIAIPLVGCSILALLLLPAMCSLMNTADQLHQRDTTADAKPSKPMMKDPAAVRAKINETIANKGEAMVRTMLKDPDSAKFGDTLGWVKHGEWAACGHVNSRNSFGAMVGNTEWVALPTKERAYIDSEQSSFFTKTWNRYCTGKADPVDADITPLHVAARELKQRKKTCGKVVNAQDETDGGIKATCSNKKSYRFNYIWETGDYLLVDE